MKPSCSVLAICLLAAIFAGVNSAFRSHHREPYLPPGKGRSTADTLWIEQKLDHFDSNNNQTWKMRYMANGEFWKKGGPIFMFVGGEWVIASGYVTNGHLYDMAKEHNGYLFYPEHRYYGESRPTSNISLANLKYLSVQQALADLAHFIRTMKATIPGMAESKVIIAGCSYSGTMVTWFKELYPDLALGVWASSAPLLAVVDFKEYKVIVGSSIRKVGGDECYNRIKNAYAEMEAMFANNRGSELTSKFNICNPFDVKKELDVETFFERITEVFADLVQGGSDDDIPNACNKIMQGSDNVSGVLSYVLGQLGSKCQELSYDGYMAGMKNISYPSVFVLGRQWDYQTCNEFGFYQTTDSKLDQPFGDKIPISLFLKRCKDAFNFDEKHVYNAVAKTNKQFGGLHPNVTNVYFTEGELDPWRALGINDQRATIISNYSHCMDFASIKPRDGSGMRASKERIAQLVREWLAA